MNQSKFRKYTEKRAEFRWPLVSGPLDGIEQIVAIPVLAEKDHLFATLESLAQNPPEELRRALIICVVNNRRPPFADLADIENNAKTLAALKPCVEATTPLRLAYIDASSPGNEFPETGGVGLARKIGLDWGLRVLLEQQSSLPLLFCLDADTRVEPNYLQAVRTHFQRPGAWAGVTAYAHPLEGAPEEQAAIICYELFLRYHVLGLDYAGSPYAFPSIGSTMVCHAEAYVAVAGMNTRQAGEDFYFLQQLAKTGRVDSIRATTVHPSPRSSPRVPFGTGQRVRRFMSKVVRHCERSEAIPPASVAGVGFTCTGDCAPQGRGDASLAMTVDEYLLYHPESYRILKSWLAAATTNLRENGEMLLGMAREINSQLGEFLALQEFAPAWDRMQRNSKSDNQALAQFHGWFDGFRTMKLIHHLRDHGLPPAETFGAIQTLLEWAGRPLEEHIGSINVDMDIQERLLEHLRGI